MPLDLAPALALLRQHIPGLAATYLFGSQVGQSARADSDIDFAVFAGRPLPRAQVVEKSLDDLLEFSALALHLSFSA